MAKKQEDDDVEVEASDGAAPEGEKKQKKPKKVKPPPGPLAPFRLGLAVCAAVVTTGLPLWDAWTSGVGVDLALGRSFGVAFVLWIVLGRVSRMLGTAQLEAEAERRRAAMHAVSAKPSRTAPAAEQTVADDIHHAA